MASRFLPFPQLTSSTCVLDGRFALASQADRRLFTVWADFALIVSMSAVSGNACASPFLRNRWGRAVRSSRGGSQLYAHPWLAECARRCARTGPHPSKHQPTATKRR
jgi:hypothetical protein